jgi:hypothetical protein
VSCRDASKSRINPIFVSGRICDMIQNHCLCKQTFARVLMDRAIDTFC